MKKFIRRKTYTEEIANSTGPAVPGTGDDAQAFPKGEPLKKYKKRNEKEQDSQESEISLMRRATPMMEEADKTGDYKTGMFAGSTTFVVPSNIFHEAKMQKRKGKHWRTYIGESDHLSHIREYAAKNPKKAIILQDENTGAMCYARYGKKDNTLSEAPLLTSIKKDQSFDDDVGTKMRDYHAGEKIARIDDDHDLHHEHDKVINQTTYRVRNNKSGVITGSVNGRRNRKTGTFSIETAESIGKGPKMHKVYRKILQTGHSRTLVGNSHSEGGQKIWQRLSSEKGVSVHGWKDNKSVNLDPKDSEETHVTKPETKGDPAAKDIYRTKLVASLHARKTV
jgi:hypothetical protein